MVQEDLQAEISHLQGRAIKTEHLAVKNESLCSALRKGEFISAGLKIVLALEEEEKKEAKVKVAELEAQISKSILEAVARAMEEFKTSFEIKDLNIAFNQKAFIKGFELYEGRIARRFPELDLDFLEEEEIGKEAGPSSRMCVQLQRQQRESTMEFSTRARSEM
ncbi:hypothetical protein COCNU_scaffold001055G000010 [Cocos nucifera]|nr:hypothetical protein [Cocos nucifera]